MNSQAIEKNLVFYVRPTLINTYVRRKTFCFKSLSSFFKIFGRIYLKLLLDGVTLQTIIRKMMKNRRGSRLNYFFYKRV